MRETRTAAQAIDANEADALEDGANPDAEATTDAEALYPVHGSHAARSHDRALPPRANDRGSDPARPGAVATPTQRGMPALATPSARAARPIALPTPASQTTQRPAVALPPSVPSATGKTTNSWQSSPTSRQLALRLRQGPGPALPPMPPEPEPPEPTEALQRTSDDPRAPNSGVSWFLGSAGSSGDEAPSTPPASPAPQEAASLQQKAGSADAIRLGYQPFDDAEAVISGTALESFEPAASPAEPPPTQSRSPAPQAEHNHPPDLDLRIERVAASPYTSETLRTDERWAPTGASLGRPPSLAIPLVPTRRPPSTNAKFIAILLIVFAFLLPSSAGPPWSLLLAPSEVTFVAFVSLLLMGVVHLLPWRTPTRDRLSLALAALLLPFAVLTLSEAVDADHFGGQPFLTHLGLAPALTAALLLGAAALIAGLTLASTPRNALAARVAIGCGLALLFTVALVPMTLPVTLNVTPADAAGPLASAFASMSGTAFLGDQVAAFALLLVLVLAALAIVVAVGPLHRFGAQLGFAAWVALTLPLVVLSVFAFRSTDWLEILAPLKTTAYLAGLVLFCASALGATLDRSRSAAPHDPR